MSVSFMKYIQMCSRICIFLNKKQLQFVLNNPIVEHFFKSRESHFAFGDGISICASRKKVGITN